MERKKGHSKGRVRGSPLPPFCILSWTLSKTQNPGRAGLELCLKMKKVLPTDRASGNETPEPFLDGITEGISGIGEPPAARSKDVGLYSHRTRNTSRDQQSSPVPLMHVSRGQCVSHRYGLTWNLLSKWPVTVVVYLPRTRRCCLSEKRKLRAREVEYLCLRPQE